jgi:predicted transcriptional regulator
MTWVRSTDLNVLLASTRAASPHGMRIMNTTNDRLQPGAQKDRKEGAPEPIAEAAGEQPAAMSTIVEVALFPAVSRAVRAIVELDIPDLLASGPVTTTDLAEKCNVRVRRLRQVLRTAATTGLVRSVAPDGFELTEHGRFLVRGHPSAARDLVLTHTSPLFQQSLDSLVESMRTGRSGIELTRGERLFDYYATHPEEHDAFNRMMIAYLGETPRIVASSYDFTSGTSIVDCGGGIGTLLAEILQAHPHLSGTLFDTPHVIEQAARHNPPKSLAARWTAQSGDFFDRVPEGRDFYVLSHIIHDWDDPEAVTILRNCAAAAAPGTRFLLVEEVVPAGDEPNQVKMLDVALFSVLAGGERTIAEFDALFEMAGLRRQRVIATDSTVSVIEVVHESIDPAQSRTQA